MKNRIKISLIFCLICVSLSNFNTARGYVTENHAELELTQNLTTLIDSSDGLEDSLIYVNDAYVLPDIPQIGGMNVTHQTTTMNICNFTEHQNTDSVNIFMVSNPTRVSREYNIEFIQDPPAQFTLTNLNLYVSIVFRVTPIGYSQSNIQSVKVKFLNYFNNGIKTSNQATLTYVSHIGDYFTYAKLLTQSDLGIPNWDLNYPLICDSDYSSKINITVNYNPAAVPSFHDNFNINIDTQYRLAPGAVHLNYLGQYFADTDLYSGSLLIENYFPTDPDSFHFDADAGEYYFEVDFETIFTFNLDLTVSSSYVLSNSTNLDKHWAGYPDLRLTKVAFSDEIQYLYVNGIKFNTNPCVPNYDFTVEINYFSITVILSNEGQYALPLESLSFSQISTNIDSNQTAIIYHAVFNSTRAFSCWYFESDYNITSIISNTSIQPNEIAENFWIISEFLDLNQHIHVNYTINPNFQIRTTILSENESGASVKIDYKSDLSVNDVDVSTILPFFFNYWTIGTQILSTNELNIENLDFTSNWQSIITTADINPLQSISFTQISTDISMDYSDVVFSEIFRSQRTYSRSCFSSIYDVNSLVSNTTTPIENSENSWTIVQNLNANEYIHVNYSINPHFLKNYVILSQDQYQISIRINYKADLIVNNVDLIIQLPYSYNLWSLGSQIQSTRNLTIPDVDFSNSWNYIIVNGTLPNPSIVSYTNFDFTVDEFIEETPNIFTIQADVVIPGANFLFEFPINSTMFNSRVFDSQTEYALNSESIIFQNWTTQKTNLKIEFDMNPIVSFSIDQGSNNVIITIDSALQLNDVYVLFYIDYPKNFKMLNESAQLYAEQDDLTYYFMQVDLHPGINTFVINYETYDGVAWWMYLILFGVVGGAVYLLIKLKPRIEQKWGKKTNVE